MKANEITNTVKLIRIEPGQYRTSDGRFIVRKVYCGREFVESNYVFEAIPTDTQFKFRNTAIWANRSKTEDDLQGRRLRNVVAGLRMFYADENKFDYKDYHARGLYNS